MEVKYMKDFLDMSDLLSCYRDLEWDNVSVTSKEFFPIFLSTGLNPEKIYFTFSIKYHHIFVIKDFSNNYYFVDYREDLRKASVADCNIWLFNEVSSLL